VNKPVDNYRIRMCLERLRKNFRGEGWDVGEERREVMGKSLLSFYLFFCPKTRIIPHFPRFFSSKLLFS